MTTVRSGWRCSSRRRILWNRSGFIKSGNILLVKNVLQEVLASGEKKSENEQFAEATWFRID